MQNKIVLLIAFLLSGCVNSNYSLKNSTTVTKSLYLNKPLLKFEMDNGYVTLKKELSDGSKIYIYRSDRGAILASLYSFDDYPPCILEIKTNKENIIKKINIIERSMKCAYILK